MINNNINKFGFSGIQAGRAIACFYFFCFCLFENKVGMQ